MLPTPHGACFPVRCDHLCQCRPASETLGKANSLPYSSHWDTRERDTPVKHQFDNYSWTMKLSESIARLVNRLLTDVAWRRLRRVLHPVPIGPLLAKRRSR